MAKMELLLNIEIIHEYFESSFGEFYQIEHRMDYRKTIGGPRFPFIQIDRNKWSVVGDKTELSELLARSADGATLEFDITFTDPNFLYYTASYLPPKTGEDGIEFIQDHHRMNQLKARIQITDTMLRNSCPIEKSIHYKSVERHWRFLLIPRSQDTVYGEICLEEAQGKLSFDKAEEINFMGKKSFLITSSQPVQLKEPHFLSSLLDISLYEKREYGKRILHRRIPIPELNKFLLKELQPNNEVIQILYI